MTKILNLLITLSTLIFISCGATQGPQGPTGLPGESKRTLIDYAHAIVEGDPEAEIIKKFVTKSDSQFGATFDKPNENMFLWKASNGKSYVADLSEVDENSINCIRNGDVCDYIPPIVLMNLIINNSTPVTRVPGLGQFEWGDNREAGFFLTNHFYKDELGRFYFDETKRFGKDLEFIGAKIENQSVRMIAEEVVFNFGLDEQRAMEVAKLTSSFKKLKNKRALSKREKDLYVKKVLGISYDAGKKALEKHIQGNSKDLELLIKKSAKINNTSPEHISDLIGEYLLK